MSLTNAQLAQKISELIDVWRNRELEMQAWISGSATGGPGLDGLFPLTDYMGVVVYTKSPAKLDADVSGLVSSASAYAAAALASQTAAETAETNAETALAAALGYRNDAASYRDLAAGYASTAGTHAANAAGSASNAALSEAAADADATQTALDAIATAADRVQTGLDAAAAAASAAAAALFDPASYVLKTGGTFTGSVEVGDTIIEAGSGYGGVNTTGAVPLIFWTNGVEQLRLTPSGPVTSKSDFVVGATGVGNGRLLTAIGKANTPLTLGTTDTASLFVANPDPLYGILMGVIGSTGNGWIQVGRVDATATAYDLQLQPHGGDVYIGGSKAVSLAGSPTVFDGGFGTNTHGTWTDYNAPTTFGPAFIQGATNAPHDAAQGYSISYGLGSNYTAAQYRLQVVWPRTSAGGTDDRPAYRLMDAGSWGSWKILAMATYDSQFSATQTFNSHTFHGGNFYRTSGGAWGFVGQDATTVYAQFYANGGSTLRGYVYGDASGFGLLYNNGGWAVQTIHGGAAVRIAGDLRIDSGKGVYLDGGSSIFLRDNATITYGTMQLHGSKNAWCGLDFASASGHPTLMFSTGSQVGGIYNQAGAGWILYDTGTQWQGRGGQALAQCNWSGSCIISKGTVAPTGGSDGDIYFQHT